MDDPIIITRQLRIPHSEIRFRTSRSSGPGGQHVNTTSSRVELLFDVDNSPSLGPRQRERLLTKLAPRIDSRGVLHLASQSSRSQAANKQELVRRFQSLLQQALRRPKRRRPTAPTKASKKARRRAKEKRARTKRLRGRVGSDDE